MIGIYILFTIISPIINKLSGGNVNFNEILNSSKYEEVFNKSDIKTAKTIESNNSRTVKDIYIQNLQNDIKIKVKQKGYNASNVYIKAKDDNNYTIEEIQLDIEQTKSNNNDNNVTVVNNIQIEIDDLKNNKTSEEKDNNITKQQKNELKKYLADTYNLNENTIFIN